jgi:DNA-binding MarR family transcriptional regulator
MDDALLQSCLDRHLDQAALNFRLDDELGTQHGLSWSDFVLLSVLDDADGTVSSSELAGRLGVLRSRLVLQLLPLEKTGLVARDVAVGGKRTVALRPGGRRLLHEARDTAGAVCATAQRLRNAARPASQARDTTAPV